MKGALSVLLVALALSQVAANNCLTVDGLNMIKSFEGFRANQCTLALLLLFAACWHRQL
jgi:hypothetical protein